MLNVSCCEWIRGSRYDEIYRLDNWTANVLLQVKNIMKNGPEGAAEDDFS